jgi:hypothetical protein
LSDDALLRFFVRHASLAAIFLFLHISTVVEKTHDADHDLQGTQAGELVRRKDKLQDVTPRQPITQFTQSQRAAERRTPPLRARLVGRSGRSVPAMNHRRVKGIAVVPGQNLTPRTLLPHRSSRESLAMP